MGATLNDAFVLINNWMTNGGTPALIGCFVWGMVSVLFSPCHLASIPLIVGYVGGQKELLTGRQAALYSIIFTIGLFVTIAILGITAAALGRMLGDLSAWWTIPVGLLLIWVSMDFLGVVRCVLPGHLLGKLKLRGLAGAFILGLAYGILSGSCTFGFIAPILAIITIQQKIATGIALILLFGLGHCLPIALAGISTALVKNMIEQKLFQSTSSITHIIAGGIIGIIGIYFIISPFVRG